VLPVFGGGAPVTGGTAIVPTRRDDLLFQASRNVFTQTFVLEHPISARSFLGVSEELRYTLADSAGYDVQTVRAGGYYGYQFSPYGSLRLGYAYRGGRFGPETSQRLQTHDIDVGFDYRRPLPRMRRTTFGFSTGSSLVTSDPHQRWEFVGTVNLRHEFDRGWFLQGDFSRNTRLVEGFGDPFFENTVSASLGGFLSRRVELLTSGGYSRGEVGFTSDRYTVVQGSARLRLAIGRYLAANAEGLVYRYDFDDNVARPDQMLQSQNRWSVRCNLTVWLPLSR
jgi:hypothetical protein